MELLNLKIELFDEVAAKFVPETILTKVIEYYYDRFNILTGFFLSTAPRRWTHIRIFGTCGKHSLDIWHAIRSCHIHLVSVIGIHKRFTCHSIQEKSGSRNLCQVRVLLTNFFFYRTDRMLNSVQQFPLRAPFCQALKRCPSDSLRIFSTL